MLWLFRRRLHRPNENPAHPTRGRSEEHLVPLPLVKEGEWAGE